MPDSYEAELEAWRIRYAAKRATRVWRPNLDGLAHMHQRDPEPPRVELDGEPMPDYEAESQET